MSKGEMDAYRELIRENIDYDGFIRERPYDAGQLDEMVELMVEAVCSKKETLRVAGNDFPQAVVRNRLLKLDREHIVFVFDCLKENTTQVRNMKQYLLAVLFNALVTMENHYATQVNHDLYGEGTVPFPVAQATAAHQAFSDTSTKVFTRETVGCPARL